MLKKTVAIIGFGWLGKPLASALKNKGYQVLAGTRNAEKVKEINSFGIVGFKHSFIQNSYQSDLTAEQKSSCDFLIINVPPSSFENYGLCLVRLLETFSKDIKIIFTSSTGVYLDCDAEIDETSELIENHPVFIAEKLLKSQVKDRITILRLAGLIGPNRHPAKFFAQKNIIPNGASPINLVRLEDVVRSIVIILEKDKFGEIYNIVNPEHPTKETYYLEAVDVLFGKKIDVALGEKQKLVKGDKFMHEMSFNYNHSLSEWNVFYNPTELN